MECSQNFSRSKLPELVQFSRGASWRWTRCASWRRTWQNVGSRCLSTTTTDISSTTDFGGTQRNFSRTDSLTLADTPTPSTSTRRTFQNCGDSSNSRTTSWKRLKMRLGTDGVSKTDEFSEKFQTAFDPPPHFRKIILQISRDGSVDALIKYMYGLKHHTVEKGRMLQLWMTHEMWR